MKTKEQLSEEYCNRIYEEGVNEEMYTPDVYQSKIDFMAGFEEGQPKWISVDIPPEHENSVLVKSKDYRRPQYDVTDINIGYLENGEWWYNEGGIINSGLGWHVIGWMELPQ